jgi:type IV secretory pathway VirB10-like protein
MPKEDNDPVVRNQVARPEGVMPKHIQTWVVLGIAALTMVVVAFSGPSTPRSSDRGQRKPAPATDPNQQQIRTYAAQLDEQVRKLQMEQARLDRVRGNGALPATSAPPSAAPLPGSLVEPRTAPTDRGESAAEQLEAERKKREYASLFASNVALSYRRQETAQGAISPAPAAVPPPSKPAASPIQARRELPAANGKAYRLLEGSVIETVLTNRLDGTFSGPVNCMVTTNVYSHDHQHLVVPKGSRVLGEAERVESVGQLRLAVTFHRLVMPDGYSVSLDEFTGMNQIGETGLKDQVNHHYLSIFGVSLALGAIAGFSQGNSYSGLTADATDLYRQGFSRSLSQSALRILDRYTNILPTITIREGTRVKVWLTGDLALPAYEEHNLPADLSVPAKESADETAGKLN